MQPEDLFFEDEMASREMSWSLNSLFHLEGSVWRSAGSLKHAMLYIWQWPQAEA